MSKLLKAVAAVHRPHIAAKMIAENGYDETKHLRSKDLHKAGIINKPELDDLDDCLADLAKGHHNGANALLSALDGSKLNDAESVKSLMAMDSDTGNDEDDDADGSDDDQADDGDPLTSDDKVTA